jgi:opacity protein-like surface antigen
MDFGKLVVFGTMFLFPPAAAAQSSHDMNHREAMYLHTKIEITGGISAAHVFRFEDRGFGTRANLGIGMEVPVWKKLRLGAEVNRTFGLMPNPVQCGAVAAVPGEPLPCTGFAREGVSAATAASFTAAYYFGNGRVQPYLLGGMSILWTRSVTATTIVYPDRAELTESALRDIGAGPTIGAGVRIAIARHLSIRPEFRLSDGTALSSANLSQARLGLSLGYAW